MAQENQIMRISGDIYIFQISNDVQGPGIGPLPAKFSYNTIKMIEVADIRKSKRGQVIAVVPETKVISGELEVLTTPKSLLAMYTQSGELTLTPQIAATDIVSGPLNSSVDRWTTLPHSNVVNLVVKSLGVEKTVSALEVTTNVATATATSHGLIAGDYVVIKNAELESLNGLKEVVSAPDVDSFTYAAVGISSYTDSSLTIKAAPFAATTHVAGVDYEANLALGMIRPITGKNLATVPIICAMYNINGITGSYFKVSSQCDTIVRIEIDGVNDACGNNTSIMCRVARARLTPKDAFSFDDEKPKTLKFDVKADYPIDIEFHETVT